MKSALWCIDCAPLRGRSGPILGAGTPYPGPAHLNGAMLDINLLRNDLDAAVARLQTRKSPQPFLDWTSSADLKRTKTIQTRPRIAGPSQQSEQTPWASSSRKAQPASRNRRGHGRCRVIKHALEASAARFEQIHA